MTLTDLANHICTQCGMTDTDDVAAAQMFLQRRLEMIWNSALWRDSLLEATLTVNPDGTTTLVDSYWIPERSVLLLPAAIETIIAARLNTNTLEVASLESYYRTNTNWLDYQGTPFEFQILKPVVMEWAAAQVLSALDTNAADSAANPAILCNFSYSPDGVTITNGQCGLNGQIGSALQLFSFSKPPTQGTVSLQVATPLAINGITYTGAPQPAATVPVTQGSVYAITPGANENGALLVNGTQTLTLAAGTTVTVTAQGSQLVFQLPNLVPAGTLYAFTLNGLSATSPYNLVWGADETAAYFFAVSTRFNNPGTGQMTTIPAGYCGGGIQFNPANGNGTAVTAQVYLATANLPLTAAISNFVTFTTLAASCNNAPMHQRIRLTEAPQVATNLRVLGKGKCPILGPYDSVPITNSEPALMAFARGDLLQRQRQFSKANLAQQEGAALLKELVENEAFQQAGEFRIQPDAGFGSDICWWTQPDSFRPLA